jgi:hypothetical protein
MNDKTNKKKTEGGEKKTRKPKGPQRPLAERITELETKTAARIAKIQEVMKKKINKMRGAGSGDPVKLAEKKRVCQEKLAAIDSAIASLGGK